MGIERVPSSFAPSSFSDAVAVDGPGRWIQVAGQVGLDPDGKVAGDLATQANTSLDHVERILTQAGASLCHVVKLTVYLTSLDNYAEFSKVRAERFAEGLPASVAVQVAGLLLDAEIEIEALAFVPS
ncbi:MAG TPA: RidA family protein [Solirubrobacterales bacterium]|nr:RidA family protein [Solirubrobacterales bacterium]